MPPVTPSRIRLTFRLCLPFRGRKRGALPRVLVRDLALGDLLEGHREVVLRARANERRRELVERAFAELMVVVVDLPRALGGDDHERVARVDLVEQLVDSRMDHRRMAPFEGRPRSWSLGPLGQEDEAPL